MRYLGWIVCIIVLAAGFYGYRTKYLPLQKDVQALREEIHMWEDVVKGDKGVRGERQRFAPERFFEENKLTPFAEVELLRTFDMRDRSIELYITAPGAFARAGDLLRFFAEQHIRYRSLSLFVVVDSVERFEYTLIR